MSEFWSTPLNETVKSSERLARSQSWSKDVSDWLGLYAPDAPTSSNQGTDNLPFQRWFHFKEAFSPKFVTDTLSSLPYAVRTCLDPFSGSGTTAITCRMLGIDSVGIEVNPFLADLIRSKLTPVSPSRFREDYERVIDRLIISDEDLILHPGMPSTFTEPGNNNRYLFNSDVYSTARAIWRTSNGLPEGHARLIRVLLGSVLVSNSNVTINGKGRRYRKNWQSRQKTRDDLILSLDNAVDIATADITRFAGLPTGKHVIHIGDARQQLSNIATADVAIFSPPYPNSFDYTDVYNIELWMLGYLNSSSDNQTLRKQTLRSHVQTKWATSEAKFHSKTLSDVVDALRKERANLWNKNIPEMVQFYFDDLYSVFEQLSRILENGKIAVVAIGDSQYAGIHINVAQILAESIKDLGFRLINSGSIRSMRNSSQHGGNFELSEHCLVFERNK